MSEFVEQTYTPKNSTSIWNTKTSRAKAGDIIEGKVKDVVEDKFTGSDGKERLSPAWVIVTKDGERKTRRTLNLSVRWIRLMWATKCALSMRV